MTLSVAIGEVRIPYEVRESARAKKKRIEVTPERVVVVVPAGTPRDGPDGIEAFLESKRRWLYEATREIAKRHRRVLTQRYASGARIMYRGRRLVITVQAADVDRVEIVCRSRFHVRVPRGLDDLARLEAVRDAFDAWLRERALKDARAFARRYQVKLGVEAAGVRIGDQRRSWGTCGKDRVVRINWRLIQAPAAAMEYVVAHEVCHLAVRHHGPAFWARLREAMPDWRERKAALEGWESEHLVV